MQVPRSAGLTNLDQDGHHGTVPVVGDNDTPLPKRHGQTHKRLQRRSAEEHESLGVIIVIRPALGAVQLWPGFPNYLHADAARNAPFKVVDHITLLTHP
jgi:hypothetical protein